MRETLACFPYCERTLTTRMTVEAYKLNNEITGSLMDKLRPLKEGRCNRYGYVAEVTQLVDYKSSEIRPEDLHADPVFEVSFNCIVCDPHEGQTIVAQIQRMNDSIICCVNGPMQVIIQLDHVNFDTFDVNGDHIIHRLTGESVASGSMIRIKILSRKFLVYDTSIKILGFLEGMASQREIETCYHDDSDTTSILKNKMSLKAIVSS